MNSKISIKKQQKQLVIWLEIKSLIKLREVQKIQSNIIQKELQMSMIKKYIKKRYVSLEERQEVIDELRLK